MWLTEPERYECQNVFEQYCGRELSEIVVESHGVRSDGKTLIGQPHVRGDNLWTVEDLRRCDVVCGDPLA
jgi:methane monooxygenase component A alpha chain